MEKGKNAISSLNNCSYWSRYQKLVLLEQVSKVGLIRIGIKSWSYWNRYQKGFYKFESRRKSLIFRTTLLTITSSYSKKFLPPFFDPLNMLLELLLFFRPN